MLIVNMYLLWVKHPKSLIYSIRDNSDYISNTGYKPLLYRSLIGMYLSVTAAILVPELTITLFCHSCLTLWGLNNVMTVDESSLGGSLYPLDISSLNKSLTLNKPDLEQT